MHYPLIVPIIGHGATDLINLPCFTIFLNMFFSILIHYLNLNNRKRLLIVSSIYHIAQDIPFKSRYIISSIIHYIWLKKPFFAKLHLSLIHTPLHYLKIYVKKYKWKIQFSLGILSSLIGNILLEKNIHTKINKYLGDLWWISPVLSHIMLTYIINEQFVYKYKKMKFMKLFKRIYII